MNRWFAWMSAVLSTAFLVACGGSDHDDEAPPQALTLAQTVQSLAKTDADPGGFSLLLAAVNAADPAVGAALGGSTSLTVMAPTNQAFGKLLAELGVTRDQLLANRALVTQVLRYHVLGAPVKRADVPLGLPVTTVEGGVFKVSASGDALVITDERNRTSRITATDVAASNGVIHVIDTVLLPGDKDLVALAQATPDLSLLVEAVSTAGLAGALQAPGPFTVFAPTNAAFVALLDELGVTKEQLFADRTLLTKVLTYHVLNGRVYRAAVPVGTPVTTLQGDTLSVDTSLRITDARGRQAAIVATDVLARNGVVHLVDRVILPR